MCKDHGCDGDRTSVIITEVKARQNASGLRRACALGLEKELSHIDQSWEPLNAMLWPSAKCSFFGVEFVKK